MQSDGVSVVRKPLTSLTENDLNNLFAPETNQRLYTAIRERMALFANDGKKAFAEPLHKPTNDGSPGPIVKSVKVCQTQNTGIAVRGGIADNGEMVRTDVFRKPNKKGKWEYYLVPVYVADVMAGIIPDRAIAGGKPYDEWPVMDDSFEFMFSLYPYDLMLVVGKNAGCLFYYKDSHRGTGALRGCLPNTSVRKCASARGPR